MRHGIGTYYLEELDSSEVRRPCAGNLLKQFFPRHGDMMPPNQNDAMHSQLQATPSASQDPVRQPLQEVTIPPPNVNLDDFEYFSASDTNSELA